MQANSSKSIPSKLEDMRQRLNEEPHLPEIDNMRMS